MATIRNLQRSFTGGELTPEFFGKIDDAKYVLGLAKCRNFVVKPQGPVENRAGFQFVREVKDSTKKVRLIPFTYSTTQTMVIEMGAGYFRFHTAGGTVLSGAVPYEVATPYTEADLFDVHYVQSADVLTLVHPNYAPRELRRLGATNWQLTTISFSPTVSPPDAPVLTASGHTTAKYLYDYVVTAVDGEGISESAASAVGKSAPKTISGITKANPGVVTTSTAHGLNVGQEVAVSGAVGMTQINGSGYVVDTVPSTTTLTLKKNGTVVNTSAYGTYTASSATLTANSAYGNLFESGGIVTISWQDVPGASRYNVYKMQGGLYGYIGQTAGTSMVDDNLVSDLSKTPPILDNDFNGAGKYPAAVSYFEQRRCFAGSLNDPQKIWMTRSGTEDDMSYSLPIRDDDRIEFRVAAREANTIRHIVPLSQLLLLTSSAEWRVTSVNSDAITPTTISVRPQSYVGASNVQPAIINNSLIYGASRGGHVYELGYSWQASGFTTGDLSIRAPHLFDGHDIVDMTYCKAPLPIVWFVSTSGKLLGITYVPEHQIGAWHQHDTDGVFESCTSVAEGSEDVLYVVVRRTINGQTKRYVERLASRQFADQAAAFFVDCGATYNGPAASVISGLSHLEGKTVAILADGAVHPRRTVSSGQITLDQEASKVHVGLPIEADLQTLPLAFQIDNGFGQGRAKNVNRAWLRVYRSSGLFVGPSVEELTEAKQRTNEPYGAPPALKNEEVEVRISPAWSDGGQIFVRQADPLPLTIASLTLEVAVGG